MSDVERLQQATAVMASGARIPAQSWEPQKRKLSRAWFDIIVLAVVAAAVAGATLMRLWPLGCGSDAVKDRAATVLRPQRGASSVTLHLTKKLWRKPGYIGCTALARIEFAGKPSEHRTIDYVVRTGRDGTLTDVEVAVRPEAP